MSYMGSKNRFSGTVIREVENDLLTAGHEGAAHVAYEVMSGINNADDTIRREVGRMRDRLNRVMTDLDAGNNVYAASALDNAAELDQAIAKRSMYFQMLTGLLGTEKVQDLLARSAK